MNSRKIIDNFLSGVIDRQQFENHLSEEFIQNAETSNHSQTHLHNLYTGNKISADQYRYLSETVTRLQVETTLKKNQAHSESYFNEDKTLHLTMMDTELAEDEDRTIIIEIQPIENDEISPVALSRPSVKPARLDTSAPDITPHAAPLNPVQDVSGNNEATHLRVLQNTQSAAEKDSVSPGTKLKNRFVLTERLGQGGMGVVYKAKDLLKVEARDRDPYVAIKVLTDAFKQYSGSFIALQREASKAQRLAHPNIATVYDFDRDGDTVFMTMEYLAGKPLNRIIKEMPDHPLPRDKALEIIEGLCHGLSYAHERNLVHSDFKPGNCFLMSDGQVKLLDFGIARAKSGSNEDREHTMFDPSKLSAVTPAYATPEMFAGMDPDPRDDIYGLACVAYQLLSGGKHPYNKVASPKVRDLGIKPKAIKGLDRRQQKALNAALTVNRKERTPTVMEFLSGLKPQKSYLKQIIGAAAIIFVVIVGVGYQPYRNFMAEQELLDTIQNIKNGNRALLIETIWRLQQADDNTRQVLTVGLRREIITHYDNRIRGVFKPSEGLYDYPQALQLLSQAQKLYPDSVAVTQLSRQLKEEKDRIMVSLVKLYERYRDNEQLLPSSNRQDITVIFPLIQRIDPNHFLLKDSALAEDYLSQAEAELRADNVEQVKQYIVQGLKFFPKHQGLNNLKNQLNL